jgi:uncharacterized membrane protein (Fun14 family)
MDSRREPAPNPPDGMPQEPPVAGAASPRRGLRPSLRDFSRWQKVMLALAVCLMVTGLGLSALASGAPPAAIEKTNAARQTPGGALPGKLLPDQPGTVDTDPAAESQTGDGAPPWSEAIFKYGFSFFIGFAIGYALRAFLKVTLIFAGALALAIFLLEYGGFVAVQWSALDEAFTGFMARVSQQSSEFRTFITGSLPNAGLSTLGLVAGFKKKG